MPGPGGVFGLSLRAIRKYPQSDYFRARINEERTSNRIDSNQLFLMNRLKVDSICLVEKYGFGFYRETTRCSRNLVRSEKIDISHKHAADEYRGEQRRATACIVACSPPTASAFFLAAQAGKLSLSASLERAEEAALKRHARDSDGDAAIEVLSFSSIFWVDRLVLVALGRSSCWWKICACNHHDFF